MKTGFIGAGRVGFSLGRFLAQGRFPENFSEGGNTFCTIQVTGYYSRRQESAEEAAKFTGTRAYPVMQEIVQDSDVLFLTVPDREISSVYRELRKYGISGKQICHCSGAMSAREAFPELEQTGAYGYSIHPLFPVSSKLNSYRELAGAFFCLEGEGPHLEIWEALLAGRGARVQRIEGRTKARYHAACVIASNLMCGLIQESLDLLGTCGFSQELALQALTPLMQSNLKHLTETGPVGALTGPVERCDTETVKKHLQCFPSATGEELYRAVSEKLIQVARKKNPDQDYRPIEDLLSASKQGG